MLVYSNSCVGSSKILAVVSSVCTASCARAYIHIQFTIPSLSHCALLFFKQQLEPLPELLDTGDDLYFSKEAPDYPWPRAPVDSTPFPTWGSTGTEMTVIGAAEAAAAETVGAVAAASITVAPPPEVPMCGIKRALPEPSSQQQQPRPAAPEQQWTRPAVAADRTIFLRQRLGGEILSSGNSSTSTCSDSASDDVTGEWEAGSGGRDSDASLLNSFTPSFSLGAGNGAGVSTGVDVGAALIKAPAPTRVIGEAGAQPPNKKTARRKRKSSGLPSKGRRRRSATSGPRGSSKVGGGGGGNVSGVAGRGGRYASWDALVKPFKQQWDHIEPPWEEPAVEALRGADVDIGEGLCSRFSARPQPDDAAAFSVEQCSARAHPTAVASYVLRVRCAHGAHVVRRTWDDLVTLCTMLGATSPAPPRNETTPHGVVGIAKGIQGGSRPTTSTTACAEGLGLEFAPPDVLGREAASSFLRELLKRPSMVWAIPARRFLELEYLDGTLKGGPIDDQGGYMARQVASAAAVASVTSTAAVVNNISATLPQNSSAETLQHQHQQQPREAASVGGSKNAFCGVSAFSATPPKAWFSPPRSALSLMAPHPDAARDLAAVYRCLGELGADAFTTTMPFPRTATVAAPVPVAASG